MDRVDAGTPASPAQPRRRRRWLRVLLWLGGTLAVLLLIACLWHVSTSRAVDSELDRLIASYRAAGQPVLLADFENPPVPDNQNAAKMYLKAAATVTLEGNAEKDLAYLYVRLTPARMDLAKTILERNAEALRLCHQAGTMAAIDWPWRPGFDADMMRIQTDSLQPLRTLGKLLGLAANYHHLRGDDAAAIQALRDGLALAEALAEGHTMLDYLVALALEGVCLGEIQNILPDLRILSRRGGVDAGEIRDLIRYLSDEQRDVRVFQCALYGERAAYIEMMQGDKFLAPLGPWGRLCYAVIQRWIRKEFLSVVRSYTAMAEAATGDSYQAAVKALPHPKDPWAGIKGFLVPDLVGMGAVPSELILRNDYRHRVQRRLAATALAMKLYERDRGHAPAALADLVSEYLPAVPSDPFDPAGGPIGYAPKSRWPALYSLGANGQDDSEARESYDPSAMGVWRIDDPVFYLTDRRPLPWDPSAYQAQQAAVTQPSQDASDQ